MQRFRKEQLSEERLQDINKGDFVINDVCLFILTRSIHGKSNCLYASKRVKSGSEIKQRNLEI